MNEDRIRFPAKLISSDFDIIDVEELVDEYQFNDVYDFTPIFKDSRYLGIINKKNYSLGQGFKELIVPLTSNIIHSESEIEDALLILQEYDFAILVDNKMNYSILTFSDLKKQPFRLYLFSLISDFEISITEIIRARQMNIVDYLSLDKYNSVLQRYEDNKANNSYIDIYQELDLVHKLEIISKSKLSNDLIISKTSFKSFRYKINALRNEISHAKIIDENRSLDDFLILINTMKDLFKNIL